MSNVYAAIGICVTSTIIMCCVSSTFSACGVRKGSTGYVCATTPMGNVFNTVICIITIVLMYKAIISEPRV